MELVILIFLGLGAGIVCLTRWRTGMYIVVLAGFLQDPIRKLLPGEPVVLTMLAAFYFGLVFVGAWLAGEPLRFRAINRWNPVLLLPGVCFLFWVCLQTLMTLATTANPVVAGIGAISYFAPLPALLAGFYFARTVPDIVRWLQFYVLCAAVAGFSVVLEWLGAPWSVLGPVGEALHVYTLTAGEVDLLCGTFRSPEIAGWHCAAAVCFIFILATLNYSRLYWLVAAIASTAPLLLALLLAGRRKFIAEIVFFLCSYSFLLVYARHGLTRLTLWLIVGTVFSALGYAYISSREMMVEMTPYLERGLAGEERWVDRLFAMTFEQFHHIVRHNGFLGAGAGTGSQGAQHFGAGAVVVGAAAEGGLGKVLAELGVPGLLLLAWLGIAVLRYLIQVGRAVRTNRALASLGLGFLAFLAANVVIFTSAHQIFGDTFVLLMLGFLLGMTMRLPWIAAGARRTEHPVPVVRIRRPLPAR